MNPSKNKDVKSDQSLGYFSDSQRQKDKAIMDAMRAMREKAMRIAVATMKEEKSSSATSSRPSP